MGDEGVCNCKLVRVKRKKAMNQSQCVKLLKACRIIAEQKKKVTDFEVLAN